MLPWFLSSMERLAPLMIILFRTLHILKDCLYDTQNKMGGCIHIEMLIKDKAEKRKIYVKKQLEISIHVRGRLCFPSFSLQVQCYQAKSHKAPPSNSQ